MYLHREDIKLIGQIMDELPNAKSFYLESDTSSGIGAIITLKVDTSLNDRPVTLSFEISGMDKW